MPKYNIAIARFPYKKEEASTVTEWLISTVLEMRRDERVAEIARITLDDTPITMTRNKSIKVARERGADLLLMVDSDMAPDLYVGSDPNAKPFWKTAFDFVTQHNGPCAIAAPYCGPPPFENVYIFRWATEQSDVPSDCPDDMKSLKQFTREDAAERRGIEQVGALPTGLILFDMRGFEFLDKPYFDYEWPDSAMDHKASTEDVVLTRNLSLIDVPQYVAWDSWAGHWKLKCVGKPFLQTEEAVADTLRGPLLREREKKISLENLKSLPAHENGKPKALSGRKVKK